MADRYWVGNGGNWSDNATHWAASTGGAPGASKPTSADNVFFDANSFGLAGQTVTIDEAAYCLSMDWTGALNNPTLHVNPFDLTGVYGNLTFINAMSITGGKQIFVRGTSIVTMPAAAQAVILTFSDDGATRTFTLASDVNITGEFRIFRISGAGSVLNTAGFSITCSSVVSNWGYVINLNLGASVITCGSWNLSNCTPTFVANTAFIVITGTGALAGGNADYNGATFQLTGTAHTVTGSFTCAEIDRVGTATKTDSVTFESGSTITCTTFAMVGNSSINRLLVQSSVLGTPAIITATQWLGSQNVDIMDITATNPVDLSAITGLSGDCGGNTGITFTVSAAQASTGAGNWDNVGVWTSRVPLPQDDVTVAHNMSVNMPRIGKSVTFNAGIATLTMSISVFGGWIGTATYSLVYGGFYVDLKGREIYQFTPYDEDAVWRFYAPGGVYRMTRHEGYLGTLGFYAGTFDTDGYNFSIWNSNSSGTLARTVYFRNSVISLITTGAESKLSWSNLAYLTFYAGSSTIICINGGATGQWLDAAGVGGLTYYNVVITGAGNYSLGLRNSSRYKTLTVDVSQAAKTLTLTPGTTQTVEDLVVLPRNHTTVVTMNTGGAVATLTGQRNWADLAYLNLTNIVAGFANRYFAANSVNGGGNTNWLFRNRSRFSFWFGRWR